MEKKKPFNISVSFMCIPSKQSSVNIKGQQMRTRTCRSTLEWWKLVKEKKNSILLLLLQKSFHLDFI